MLQSLLKNKAPSSAVHVNDFRVWPLPPAWPDSPWLLPGVAAMELQLKEGPGQDREALPGPLQAEGVCGRTGLLTSELGCPHLFPFGLLPGPLTAAASLLSGTAGGGTTARLSEPLHL